jgi:hypothetical protein
LVIEHGGSLGYRGTVRGGRIGPLEWERLDERRASRIRHTLRNGGLSIGETAWPTIQDPMVDAMRRLIDALKPFVRGASA